MITSHVAPQGSRAWVESCVASITKALPPPSKRGAYSLDFFFKDSQQNIPADIMEWLECFSF